MSELTGVDIDIIEKGLPKEKRSKTDRREKQAKKSGTERRVRERRTHRSFYDPNVYGAFVSNGKVGGERDIGW